MRYLVISDTHGHIEPVLAHRRDYGEIAAVIGAGDFYRDGAWIAEMWGLPYYGAQGNNDHEPQSPWSSTFRDGRVVGFVIHGHQWEASRRLQGLCQVAKAQRADILVYGHTHRRRVDRCQDATLLNPGAVYAPRGGEPRTVALLDIAPNGSLSWEWLVVG